MNEFFRIESISQIHQLLGLEKPRHPLITIIQASDLKGVPLPEFGGKVRNELYLVSLKNGTECKFIYGRASYDFQEGTVIFLAPGQVVAPSDQAPASGGDTELGWMLFFHPSLIHGTPLAKKLREYTFFSYRANEALHVSEQERTELAALLDLIKKEYGRNLDAYSAGIILSNLELLFGYFQRYYGRQFLTRAGANHDILARFEEVLELGFSGEGPRSLPTVKACAERLGYSPNYLSDLLKKVTGKSAQEQIHARLIEKAKDLLLGTTDPVNRVAYALGFEYPQHFSKLFRKGTGLTPGQFRRG